MMLEARRVRKRHVTVRAQQARVRLVDGAQVVLQARVHLERLVALETRQASLKADQHNNIMKTRQAFLKANKHNNIMDSDSTCHFSRCHNTLITVQINSQTCTL